MKKIEAVIRPEKLEAVINALDDAGYPGVTVYEVQGHGKQRGISEVWRGQKYELSLLPKVRLELVVKNGDLDKMVLAIVNAARTNSIGDGKIFISDIAEVIRIRTGEKGDIAVG